ncbi:MAG: hypothetical protein AB1898_21225 [Acidobacteriota bacterium]
MDTDPQIVTAAGWRARLQAPVSELLSRHNDVKEIVIEARNFASASKALDLIAAGVDLYNGPIVGRGFMRPYSPEDPNCAREDSMFRTRSGLDKYITALGLWKGCRAAAKASWRKQLQYALTKFHQSQSLFVAHPMDLDPSRRYYMPLSALPDDHVRFAYAIIAAYSVVEELGLEVRASREKPSRLPGGRWDPDVRADLEKRLHKAGINVKERSPWMVRGPKRRIHLTPTVMQQKKYAWARGWVQDRPVELVDAIAHASWLRSKVASHRVHKSKPLIDALSPYDVCNVQFLAQRLILEMLDLWKQA